jgi:acyl carrier protein
MASASYLQSFARRDGEAWNGFGDVVSTREVVYGIIGTLLELQGRTNTEITDESPIQEEGLGFDSLTVAELSAKLEEQLGRDPYTEGQYPATVRDLLLFYA